MQGFSDRRSEFLMQSRPMRKTERAKRSYKKHTSVVSMSPTIQETIRCASMEI